MPFGLKVKFIEMAQQHDTVSYTMYNDEKETLYIYFENGTAWGIEYRG